MTTYEEARDRARLAWSRRDHQLCLLSEEPVRAGGDSGPGSSLSGTQRLGQSPRTVLVDTVAVASHATEDVRAAHITNGESDESR